MQVYVMVCVHMCEQVPVYTCGQKSVVNLGTQFLRGCPSYSLRQHFSLVLSLTIQLGWLISNCQESACLYHPKDEITSACYHAWFLIHGLEIKLGTLMIVWQMLYRLFDISQLWFENNILYWNSNEGLLE